MMPFGMSMGAGNHLFQQHYGNGALQRNQQHQQLRSLRTLTTAAAAATAGAAGVHLYRTGRLPLLHQRSQTASPAQPLVQIPRELAEVICGAIGEIVQVAVLYPLDTIKVSKGAWPWVVGICLDGSIAVWFPAAGFLCISASKLFRIGISISARDWVAGRGWGSIHALPAAACKVG